MTIININKLKTLLKDVYAWKILISDITRYNLYFTKNFQPESSLSSKRKNIEITVYKNFEEEIGESSFNITCLGNLDSISDIKNIKKKIDEALLLCDYSRKPYYTLPRKQKMNRVKLASFKNPEKYFAVLLEKIKKELRRYKDIKLNSLEFHTSIETTGIINSSDVDASQKSSHFMVEMTITAKKGSKEQEFVAIKHLSTLNLNVKQFVEENVKIARDILNSTLPETFKGAVMISGYAVSEFFSPLLSLNPLVMHASAKMEFMKLSRYKLGMDITENINCEKINLTLNPLIDLNPSSSSFDDDGVASKITPIIKEGRFIKHFASKQYADYLGVEATGAMGCVEISPGVKSLRSLTSKKPIVEIIAFSSFVPNSISGDFSAEIRLGYMYKKDKTKLKKIPFKGGMFTGNVFDLIKNTYFSKEIKGAAGYKGPIAVLFMNGMVAGMK